MRLLNVDTKDILTSKVSTFPYDDEKMQKMISLVQNAKGMLLCKRRYSSLTCSSGAKTGLEHYTVVTSEHTLHTISICCLSCYVARLLCFFGKRVLRITTGG